jgi:transcriptional regulator with XRE-family HTH domain
VSENVELSSLDLRYEEYRLRDDAREARVLTSITQRGIEDPLEGVDRPPLRILLNGFKRFRSARKLGLGCVPYVSLGPEEATGILNLMRAATDKALGILEQARFLVDLLTVHGMSLAEVAETLGRSKAWVSMRRSLLTEMSPAIQTLLFRGTFPVYSYLYTLRAFRRMNGVTQEQIEQFAKAVAGRRLSVRDIDLLARGYFQGPVSLREAIDAGKLSWPLEQMKRVPDDVAGCSEFERVLLNDLAIAGKYLRRVMTKCDDARLKSRAFQAQAHLLSGGLLSSLDCFRERMEAFHDRSGRA